MLIPFRVYSLFTTETKLWLKKFPFKILVIFTTKFLANKWSSKQIVVASVKKHDATGTNFTLRLFKNDSEEFRFNQTITLSAAEFDLLGQKTTTIQDLSSRGTTKKNKRRKRSGCESDLEERHQYEGGREKKSRQKITNSASESDKEN